MNRKSRLESARRWIRTYKGKDLVTGYSRWYGVDKVAAVVELQLLGVPDLDERKQHEMKSAEQRAQQRARRKEIWRERERELEGVGYDDIFAQITGYTLGGVEYGVTGEEWEQPTPEALPNSEKSSLGDDDDIPF